MRRTSYKDYLKTVGRKPIPPYEKLRGGPRKPGDRELTSTGVVVHG